MDGKGEDKALPEEKDKLIVALAKTLDGKYQPGNVVFGDFQK